ncbi:MAG: ACT domain-containing protein [Lachnospiraceae bacterium]|jgi:ACT domain-containing protein|nr:ACT domain-containing protein [Lachnospiraceae bacterium]
MKAIITVIGMDRVGIIANVSNVLMNASVNIEDISQTIMQGYFMMYMLVDLSKMEISFEELSGKLNEKGKELEMQIRIQKEEIFKAMHTI